MAEILKKTNPITQLPAVFFPPITNHEKIMTRPITPPKRKHDNLLIGDLKDFQERPALITARFTLHSAEGVWMIPERR